MLNYLFDLLEFYLKKAVKNLSRLNKFKFNKSCSNIVLDEVNTLMSAHMVGWVNVKTKQNTKYKVGTLTYNNTT